MQGTKLNYCVDSPNGHVHQVTRFDLYLEEGEGVHFIKPFNFHSSIWKTVKQEIENVDPRLSLPGFFTNVVYYVT